MARYLFGPLAPDLPPVLNQGGLLRANNVVPIAGGYGPMRGLAAITGATALTARCRGTLGAIDSGGNALIFCGDETKLYRVTELGAVDVSKAGGYGAFDMARWEFARMSDAIVATSFTDPPQVFDLVTSTLFSDLHPNAPRARHATVVENFMVLGNIYDPELGLLTNGISWSARGNPFSWPVLGTDLAVAAQSDRHVFEGDGGWVHGIVSGAEVGAVFLEHEVWRMDYRGGDLVFEFNRVEANKGLLIPGGFVPFGRQVFYISEDGFYLFDYVQSRPIGKDRINDFFFGDLDSTYIDRVTLVRDPDQSRIYVGYPGAGHSGGTPNKLLIYDWILDKFTTASITHEVLGTVISPGVTLDTLPDDTLDDPPLDTTSFDDRVAVPGALRIGAFNTSHILSDFNGSNLEGTLETGDLELNPGRRSFVSQVRPIVDTKAAKVQIATKGDRLDATVYGKTVEQDPDGKCPFRADGRYHRVRVKLPAGFSEAVGIDIEGRPTGRR